MLKKLMIPVISACCCYLWFMPWTIPQYFSQFFTLISTICLVTLPLIIIYISTLKWKHRVRISNSLIPAIAVITIALSPVGYIISYMWFTIAWAIAIIQVIIFIKNVVFGGVWKYNVLSVTAILLYYTIAYAGSLYGFEPPLP